MRRARVAPLYAGLLGSVAIFSCTFRANDYKLVPASDGGSGGSGSALAEAGAAGESSGCVNHSAKPFVVFSPDDLHLTTVDRFTVVPGVTEVFALAFITVPNGSLMQTHALMRTIVDANFGTAKGIADLTLPGTFVFGGAWASATEIDIVGADQRGIIQLTIPLNSAGNPDLSVKTNLVVTPLDTPADCAQTVRALRIARNSSGSLAYAATCVPDPTKPASYSLWLNTPALAKTVQVGATGVDLDNLVRAFVRNGPSGATTNLIMVGQDGTASSDFRTGNGPAELKAVSTLLMTTEPGWLQEVLTESAADADGGTVMTVTKFHNQGSGYAPVEVWAGQIASNAYASLTAVPPTQLKRIATYPSASEAFVPQEWMYRNSSAYVVAEDEFVQHNLAIWTLDATGAKSAPDFPLYSANDTNNVITAPRISPLTLSNLVAWVETSTSSGTAVYADSVTCP